MKKKLLSLLLALAMVISLFPTMAFAADTTFATLEHDGVTTNYSSTYGYSNSNNTAAADAINAAVSGDTVHIIANVYLQQDATLASGATLVIDSGVTLQGYSTNRLIIPADSTLTINGTLNLYKNRAVCADKTIYYTSISRALTDAADANDGRTVYADEGGQYSTAAALDLSNVNVSIVVPTGQTLKTTGGIMTIKKGTVTGGGAVTAKVSYEHGDNVVYVNNYADISTCGIASGETMTVNESFQTYAAITIPAGAYLNIPAGMKLTAGSTAGYDIVVDSDKVIGDGTIVAEGAVTASGRTTYYAKFQNAYDAISTGGTITVSGKTGVALPNASEFSGDKYLNIAADASVTVGTSGTKTLTIADGNLSGDGTITSAAKIV